MDKEDKMKAASKEDDVYSNYTPGIRRYHAMGILLGDTIAAAQKYYIGEDSKKKRDAALTVNELFKVK